LDTQAFLSQWQHQKNNDRLLSKLVSKVKKVDHTTAQFTHEQVFSEMDCLQCANCCKSIPPIVSMRDAKRIAKTLGLSKSEFLNQYTITDEDGDMVINASPCPFLLEDNKCQIYEERPSACRLYPHSGEQLFRKNLSHHKRNMKYCPGLLEIMMRLSEAR